MAWYTIIRRRWVAKQCKGDPEKDQQQKALAVDLKTRAAVHKPLALEVAPPSAALVCKSVFADSDIPDDQDWAVRSSWERRREGIVTENPYRANKARGLTEGISAPVPEVQHVGGWGLESLLSAEPPLEVKPPSPRPPTKGQRSSFCSDVCLLLDTLKERSDLSFNAMAFIEV